MNQQQFNAVARQLNAALSPEQINTIARDTGFCQRQRKVEPFQLLVCLLLTMACEKTETVADIQRRFVEWSGSAITYRAFRDQLKKTSFPDFVRQCLVHLLNAWALPSQGFAPDSPFSRFKHILLQDGSSFALSDSLSDHFPGRFSEVSPAAVELQVTMDLLSDQPCAITLTPDTASERDSLPPIEDLADGLILVDRGYFDLQWFRQLHDANGFFIARCLNTVNPKVEQAWSESGRVLTFAKGQKLQTVTHKLLKRKRTELQVCWQLKGRELFRARLIAFWDKTEQRYTWLVTNLPRDGFTVAQVSDAYRLRWQIELLFKEWKSYANLHRFDTGEPAIAEGLIWSSIAAAVLKRFICLSAQRIGQRALSTRRAAMCGTYTLLQVLISLMHRQRCKAKQQLGCLIRYLCQCAQRAHPKREQKTGRSTLGLTPLSCA